MIGYNQKYGVYGLVQKLGMCPQKWAPQWALEFQKATGISRGHGWKNPWGFWMFFFQTELHPTRFQHGKKRPKVDMGGTITGTYVHWNSGDWRFLFPDGSTRSRIFERDGFFDQNGPREFVGESPFSRRSLPFLCFFCGVPSGKLTVCYWKLPFIVSFPIKNGDFS